MIPTSTYRLQLHAGFTFHDALGIVDYLDALGVGAAYLSPILRAEPGSTHGYDVVDPTCVSPELGGEEAFARLCNASRSGSAVSLIVQPQRCCERTHRCQSKPEERARRQEFGCRSRAK